ncbi:MAG: helix-turn-helix domain-containing protein [Cyanobacteria bacterium REEB65]|nr:helix-turn-helix domain-containing protein [Cyanobacteria bacterium REEB65]
MLAAFRRGLWRAPAPSWVPESPSALIAAWQQARSHQTLGSILNLARVSRGLSLLQLQTATGIHATYLVKLEHNLVAQPSLFVLVQLADSLDVELEVLVSKLAANAYSSEDLQALERRWHLCLLAQPGNRNGLLMLKTIHLLKSRMFARY